jgi:hypothetical protein
LAIGHHQQSESAHLTNPMAAGILIVSKDMELFPSNPALNLSQQAGLSKILQKWSDGMF